MDDIELTDLNLFAFEINSPPSGFKCAQCLQECDNEWTKHESGKNCFFFMSDICIKNYFQKDAKFHLCPVCNEKMTQSSFIKTGTIIPSVELYNVPIILMHDKKSFGYPRLLKLPYSTYVSDLFEIVKKVVPQGKYSLHKMWLTEVRSDNFLEYAIAETGCEIPKTGQVCIFHKAITVQYHGSLPKISPPILHRIDTKQSPHYPTSLFDTSQLASGTNNPSKNSTLPKAFEKVEDPKVDDPQLSNTIFTVKDPKFTVLIWPKINIDLEENFRVTEHSKIDVPTWMSDDFPEVQMTTKKDRNSEIGDSNSPGQILANALNEIDTQTEIWEDYFGFQYKIDETDGKKCYKCTTEKVWSLFPNKIGEQPLKIPYFHDLSIGKSFKSIYIDVNGNPVDYKILGPITVTEQYGNELIIRTCASFRSSHYFVTGQVLFMKSDDFFTPYGIITCSLPEENEYRYIISNYKQQTFCLSCEDTIQEIPFNRMHCSIAKDEDFDVCYWEQRVENEERLLKYLNRNCEVVYTCCDTAFQECDPMNITWHWLGDGHE
ncbi:uncharacterized protein LOC117182343 isoform X2 [Belonocnema kinseyi]|nr:uncharacterized protein LOC117182343 isoform X2 [Belonocnema kinseyi]